MSSRPEINIELPYKFVPRWYQLPILQALDKGKKRVVACLHRGAGKDLLSLNYLIKRAFQDPGVYLHCFPNFSQAKRAIWKSNHSTDEGESISYLDHIPPELIKTKNSSEMIIEFINGSIYALMGLDGKNAMRARGMNPKFIILSEYAYMDPDAWRTLEPRISANKGTAIFISTPNGQNHFYNLYNTAKANPDKYYATLLTINDTKILDDKHIENLRQEGFPEDFIQQEYYCSFSRGAEGSYYGKLIQAARDENRITELKLIPDLPCHTSWDIGIGDSTAIWIFQILPNSTYHFVHYYECNGEGLQHFVDYISEWKRKNRAIWGNHFVPHDMRNEEFGTGITRLATARNLGIEMKVVEKLSVDEGIQSVRSVLPLCQFDAEQCKRGIQCLDFYRKKWNDTAKVYYDKPFHDQWSHGADSFRYAILGSKMYSSSGSLEDDMGALRKFWG